MLYVFIIIHVFLDPQPLGRKSLIKYRVTSCLAGRGTKNLNTCLTLS